MRTEKMLAALLAGLIILSLTGCGADKAENTKPESAGPQFDINYWIEFARKYAENIGLAINPEAVSCWDNPIIAGPNSKYLERDIKARMNRYKNVEGFTDIWVWAEPDGSGNYSLFIGYA